MSSKNVQTTMIRLWTNSIVEYARHNVTEVLCDEEQEAREWEAIADCLAAKAVNPNSRMGDTWSLAVLGFKSPSWVLGIQA